MTDFSLISAFLIGVAGGVHCLGMCGGVTLAMRAASPSHNHHFPYALSYHCGRITSYAIAGALTGFIGGMITTASHTGAIVLKLLSIVMLVLMAMYIGQWYRGLTHLERIGAKLWRIIQPISARFIPFKHPLYAFPYGLIWGWLPCGLVYSTLTWSLASQSAVKGSLIMLAFGLGTFPTMLIASSGAGLLINAFKHPMTRHFVAACLLLYALALLSSFI